MIPNDDNYEDELEDELEADFELESEPSLTFAMRFGDESDGEYMFMGKVDGEDAIRQAVVKILNTERYESEIYSWDYGVELKDLFGMPMSYAMSELKRRIRDALIADDRIESVDDFAIEASGRRTVRCAFTVTAAQGIEIREEMEVSV